MLCAHFGGLTCKQTLREKDFVYEEPEWFRCTEQVRDPKAAPLMNDDPILRMLLYTLNFFFL